jgi:hypothetical protein
MLMQTVQGRRHHHKSEHSPICALLGPWSYSTAKVPVGNLGARDFLGAGGVSYLHELFKTLAIATVAKLERRAV